MKNPIEGVACLNIHALKSALIDAELPRECPRNLHVTTFVAAD
jgi:hypothetical protein